MKYFLTCYKTNAVSSGVKCGKYEYACLKIYLVLNIESAANNQIKVPISEIAGSLKKKKKGGMDSFFPCEYTYS